MTTQLAVQSSAGAYQEAPCANIGDKTLDAQYVDVTKLIDERPVSRFQIRVFLLCSIVVFLDGIDYQIIGLAAPLLARDLGIALAAFGIVFSAGMLGGVIGGLTCGLIADRFGRKRTLVATTLLFGCATALTTLSTDLTQLSIARFATGLGLGGAVPCFLALASEYAPKRRRATIVSLLWGVFPLGGMVGGLINSYLIRNYDWHQLFWVWGVAPVFAAIMLAIWLPESVRFLMTRGSGSSQSIRLIVQKISGVAQHAQTYFATEETLSGIPLRHLFSQGRTLCTLPLWIAFFVVFGSLTVLTVWTPILIMPHGFGPADAALIVAINGSGSLLGTSSAGRLVERFGVARLLLPAFMISAITVVYYGTVAVGSFSGLAIASFAAGLFLGLSTSSSLALSAVVYPTAIRSTGIGWAMGMGRFGAVVGPLAVGVMVAMHATVGQVFIAVGAALLLATPCIVVLDRFSSRSRGFHGTDQSNAARDRHTFPD